VLARFALLALLLAAATASGAGNLPTFPKKLGAPVRGSPVAADLTGSGEHSVAAAAGHQVFAFSLDGKAIAGFPVSLGKGEEAVGDLAAADVDGDGRAEIAVATKSGKLFLLSRGAPAAGFPVELGAACAAGPSLADVDGDGRPEVLQGDASGKLHVLKAATGAPLPGFPVQLGEAPLTSSPSVGKLEGRTAIAVGSERGPVHVVDASGAAIPGFPMVTHFAVNGAPAFGDVNDDGRMDLVAASRDFSLHAVSAAGEKLPGFPVNTGLACFGAPALLDVNRDDALEVAFTSSDSQLHVVQGNGKPAPGFPVKFKSTLLTGAAAADVNRDGVTDLLVAERDGLLHAISGTGARIGAPVKLGAPEPTAPFAARGRDGAVVAFVGTPDGKLHGVRYDSARAGKGAGEIAWAGPGRDAGRGGLYRGHQPRYVELKLEPEQPRVDDALRASWRYFSAEGTAEGAPPIAWFRNGARVKELDGKKELPARTAKKGEKWRYELQLPTHTARGPERAVLNTAPGTPALRIVPAEISVRGSAKVEVVTPAQDADGDKVVYRHQWLVDGARTDLGTDSVPAPRLKKGQRWTAVVTAFDGDLEGKPGFAEALVGNSPPDAPVFALQPKTPRKGDAIAAQLQRPSPDPDGDSVTYRYRWSINGDRKNYPLTLATLPPEPLRKGDQVDVEIAGHDGKLEGATWTGGVRVVNTPPPPPKLQLSPAAPAAGKPIRAVVTGAPADADGDAVTYRVAWKRNGAAYAPPADPFEVPAPDVKKGDRWEVTAIPNDGEEDGKASSAQGTVKNTPPTRPLVRLTPERPTTGGPLTVEIAAESTDIDGDPVRHAFAWTRNGAPLGKDSSRRTIPPQELKKHERVLVTVTPSDGTDSGEAGTAEVEVQNALPTAPAVALEPATPTNQEPLRAVIQKPATDSDGDALTYRYAWFKGGARQAYPDGQATVPAADLRKGDRWEVRVVAWDGEAAGPEAAAATTIGNAAPPPPKVTLLPARPRRGEALRAVVEEVPDPDGDVLAYRFAWRRNGELLSLPPSAAEVARDVPRKGDTFTVDVFASDGLAESKAARAEVKVVNTPPAPPAVSLCDGPVRVGTAVQLRTRTASADVDGDAVTDRYAWTVNGQPRAAWAGKSALAGADLRKHERMVISVTPFDGAEAGPAASAECQVVNTVPTAPGVALEPAEPTAETGLTAKVTVPSKDADGDSLVYRYRWLRNGAPVAVPVETARLPPGSFRGGDVLAVSVAAFDGEEEGPAAAASARPKNTPPPAPKLSLTPAQPVTGQALRCEASAPEKDADGDVVALRVRWTRYGQAVPLVRDAAELPAGVVRKGEVWGCDVWTDDGQAVSPVVSAQVTVKNSLPGAPTVAVEPEAPTTEDDLTCRVSVDAADLDGDPVKYRYAWTRNGQPVAALEPPAVIPAKLTSKGETWRCEAIASDGVEDGPAARAERAIANAPPTGGRVAIAPAPPAPGKPLQCTVVEPATDPDGDPVEYRFYWYKDGKPQSFAAISREAPGRMVASRDLWSCEIQASDGQADGPRLSSGAVAVP
jgi:hypothetical protein